MVTCGTWRHVASGEQHVGGTVGGMPVVARGIWRAARVSSQRVFGSWSLCISVSVLAVGSLFVIRGPEAGPTASVQRMAEGDRSCIPIAACEDRLAADTDHFPDSTPQQYQQPACSRDTQPPVSLPTRVGAGLAQGARDAHDVQGLRGRGGQGAHRGGPGPHSSLVNGVGGFRYRGRFRTGLNGDTAGRLGWASHGRGMSKVQ